MKSILLGVLALAVSSAAFAGNSKDVKVYLSAASTESAEGFVDPNAKQLLDSEKDVRKHLEDKVTLVATPTEADVVLNVVGREYAGTNSAETGRDGLGRIITQQQTAATVYIEMSAGSFKETFYGSAPPTSMIGTWSYAAKMATNAALRWIDANRAQLLAARKKP